MELFVLCLVVVFCWVNGALETRRINIAHLILNFDFNDIKLPAKILSPFLSTAPLQYVPKIQFTQATIDCLTNNKTENIHNNETVILNFIGGDPISRNLSNEPFLNVL